MVNPGCKVHMNHAGNMGHTDCAGQQVKWVTQVTWVMRVAQFTWVIRLTQIKQVMRVMHDMRVTHFTWLTQGMWVKWIKVDINHLKSLHNFIILFAFNI